MIKADTHHTFERYRLITILSGTALIGVLLIFIAVYHASRDLELIQDIHSLHKFLKASMPASSASDKSIPELAHLTPAHYQLRMLQNGKLESFPGSDAHDVFPFSAAELEESRINQNGGHIQSGGKTYTWAMLPATDPNNNIVLIHAYDETPSGILKYGTMDGARKRYSSKIRIGYQCV